MILCQLITQYHLQFNKIIYIFKQYTVTININTCFRATTPDKYETKYSHNNASPSILSTWSFGIRDQGSFENKLHVNGGWPRACARFIFSRRHFISSGTSGVCRTIQGKTNRPGVVVHRWSFHTNTITIVRHWNNGPAERRLLYGQHAHRRRGIISTYRGHVFSRRGTRWSAPKHILRRA